MSTSVRSKILAAVIILALAAGGLLTVFVLTARKKAQQQKELGQEEAVAVEVSAARRGDIERPFLFTGTLTAENQTGVSSKLPGKVSRDFFE